MAKHHISVYGMVLHFIYSLSEGFRRNEIDFKECNEGDKHYGLQALGEKVEGIEMY